MSEDPCADDAQLVALHTSARASTIDLALRPLFEAVLDEGDAAAASSARGPELLNLFDNLHAQSSLVAVGTCQTRLVVLEPSRGRVLLAPRTFAGLGKPLADADLNRMRYGVRIVNLEGGPAELERLLLECRRHRSARVLCTRVIDMVGLADTPYQAPATSYVHFGLGDWQLLSADDTMVPIGDRFARFAALVRMRVNPPTMLRNEARTLDDPAFMLRRLGGELAGREPARRLAALDGNRLASQSAAGLAARAFGKTTTELDSAAMALIDAPEDHAAVADYLSGRENSAAAQRAAATQLGAIAFDLESGSRVRAFVLPATGASP